MEKTKTLKFANLSICFPKVCFLLALCLLSTVVKAQSDTSRKLKEVKILTQQIPQVQTIIPQQTVNASDFARYNALTVADAIRDFSGVTIKDYGGIGGLKTVSVRSLGANHLAVLYDGVALSDVQNGQIDLGKLNLNNVQSITLYNAQPPQICQPARSFASASVLSINTIHPILNSTKPYQIQAGVSGGSFGLINPYLTWQQRISKYWSFVMNGYTENADGKYKYKVNGDGSDTLATRINSDVSVQQAGGSVYWAKSDSNKFNLHINYYNSDRGLPGAVINYNPFSSSRLYNQDFFAQAGYDRVWHNHLHLLINSKFSQDYLRYIDPSYLNAQHLLDEQYKQYEFYQSAAIAYNLTSNWEISYAADVSYAKLDASLPNYLYPNRFTLLNVLATNFKFGNWLLQGSLLETHINERVNSGDPAGPVNKLSPTLVVNYRINSNLQLRAFYKDIFRMPTFDEQYFFAVLQTRNIKPEYSKQYDAGLTYSKSLTGVFNYVTLTADGYYNSVSNKIITLPNQNLAIPSVVNLGNVDVKGADIGIKTQLNVDQVWKASLSVNYTYQQALDVSDPFQSIQIPYTPTSTIAVNAGIFNGRFGFYVNQVYFSSRYYLDDNSPEYSVPGFGVSDATAVYNFAAKGKPLTISAGINNIFNARYDIVRSFPMPGRSFRLSLQITI